MYPKIAAGVGDTRLETPQRLTVQTPAPARGTHVRLSCDPWGGPERTTSHSRFQKGVAGREFFFPCRLCTFSAGKSLPYTNWL